MRVLVTSWDRKPLPRRPSNTFQSGCSPHILCFAFSFQDPAGKARSIFPTVSEETGKERWGSPFLFCKPPSAQSGSSAAGKHLSRQENYLAARGDRQRDKAREGPEAGPAS